MKKGIVLVLFLLIFILTALYLYKIFYIEKKVSEKTVYLSDMRPLHHTCRFWKDKNSENHQLLMNELAFDKGLCMPSNAEIVYSLEVNSERFESVVGHHMDFPEYEGKVKFIVYLDDIKVYESKWLEYGQQEEISIPLKDAFEITLRVKDNGDVTNYALWADAKLISR